MKIVHLLDTFEVGGAQRVALEIVRHQIRADHSVLVLGVAGPLRAAFDATGAATTELPARLPHPRAIAKVGRYIAAMKPDLIHSHQRRESMAGVLLAKVMRSVAVEHAHTVLPGRTARVFSFRSNQVISVSPEVTEMLMHRFRVPPRRITQALNAPVVADVAQSDATAAPTWKGGGTRILGVGRLSPQKDPSRFVRTVQIFGETTEATAVWVGDGELLNESESLAAELDARVTFVGRADNIADWMDSADVLLMTSRWEGLPLVALEGLALGLTLVAPAVDGLQSLLAVPGREAGYLYPVDEVPSGIAKTLLSAVQAPDRAQRSENGRALIREKYNPQQMLAAVDSAYRRAFGHVE